MGARLDRYRLFGTTADVGVISYGKDIKEAYENQAAGMFSIMVDLRGVKADAEFQVEAEGPDLEGLLSEWLEELLFLSDKENVFLREFRITFIKDLKLRAVVKGEPMEPARHAIKTQVKAVTHHRLEVRETSGGVMTRVVYDI